jgi:nitronate monooxygenase/enoyl-[acyl-carrier protein] reductase II
MRIHTRLCERLGIEHPIIQAAMGTASSAELAAAVSNAGALGSVGTLFRPLADLRRQLARMPELTQRPYAVNHVVPVLDEAAFQATLDARPRVISFALGDPGEWVKRAHDAGALVMHQVTTVRQAEQAAARGVDLLVAQGSESGGYGGTVAALPLVPQVVDAVHPIPVVAAGGIFDGRGVAAALLLGAGGVNIGTRFLASPEASIGESWRQAITTAASEDAVKADVLNDVMPLPGTGGYGTVVRSVRTPFIDSWQPRRDEARARAGQLLGELGAALQSGRGHEFLLVAGQTVGGIRDVLPAAEIVRRLLAETEAALAGARDFLRPG